MNISLIAAIVCVVAWVVLAFVVAIPTGWVHLPLALASVLFAKGVVEADTSRE